MKWFKHMSDASHDEAISQMEAKYGLEGYARWWKILEKIAQQMDDTDKCSATYPMSIWCGYLTVRRPLLARYLVDIQWLGLINHVTDGPLLTIEVPNLLKIRDNTTANLQAKKRSLASKEVEVEVDKEVEQKERGKGVSPSPPTIKKDVFRQDLFNKFWNMYPEREGRKVGEEETERLFFQLNPEEVLDCLKAVGNYAKSKTAETHAKDPVNFLTKGYWKGWIEEGSKPLSESERLLAEIEGRA